MKISVSNFRGCERAIIEAAPVALIAGTNHSGKSSICLAVAAALTGSVIPYLKFGKNGPVSSLLKSQAGILVRAGMDKGAVSVESGTGKMTVTWPNLECKSEGQPPYASIYATGLLSIVDLDDKARSAALSNLLSTVPTKEDLAESLPEISSEKIEKIWDAISINGWDHAHNAVRERGAVLKGQWEGVTSGERYGATKAAGWIPSGWDEALAGSSEDALAADVAKAKRDLETMIADTATSEAEAAHLKQTIADAENLPDLTKDCAKARKEHEEATAARNALPPLLKDAETCKCPHCQKEVVVIQSRKGYELREPDKGIGKAEYEKRGKALDAAIAVVMKKSQALQAIEQNIAKHNALREMAGRAKTKLTEIEAAAAKRPSETAINEAREAVRIAEDRLRMFTSKTGADRLHASIERNQLVIDVLTADGLRKRKLVRALDEFNAFLKTLTDKAGFRPVSVDEDMNIRLGGRLYALLSASEQYRVRAVFQIALAVKDGSSVVILDGADILDTPGRNGLFVLLPWCTTLRVIVGMTYNKPEQVPDLSALGIGESFWIDDGVCRPISKEAAAA